MKPAPSPPDEASRLQALQRYAILDTEPERQYDDITLLASAICRVPIAAISLIDETRQWFKSRYGIEANETPRDISFCGHAIHGKDVFVVEDAFCDERFSDNPMVQGNSPVRFYAGAPLITPDGYALGTLCVVDREPRSLNSEQLAALQALARQVVQLFEHRRAHAELVANQAKMVYAAKMISLGEIAGGIAHEINNPLSIIIGRVELLLDKLNSGELDPPKFQRHLENVLTTATRIGKIVRGLRAFSRNELNDPIERVQVDTIVNDVFGVTQERAKNLGVKIEYVSRPGTFFIGRSTQISQILINLVVNAFDAIEGQTEKWIRIETRSIESRIEIRVTDSGCGISKEIRNRIMDPFFTTKAFGKGTGLGLSISKGLAESNGGGLQLDTDQIHTTFVLSLRTEASQSGEQAA